MKICVKCTVQKPLDQFQKNLTKKDGLQSSCRECQNKYTRTHYRNNKSTYVAKANKNTEKYKQIIREIKEASPCKDCGKKYPYYVMDFDHLGHKEENVSVLIKQGKIAAARKEIAKCELVCSNCHRERTHMRSVSETDITQVYET